MQVQTSKLTHRNKSVFIWASRVQERRLGSGVDPWGSCGAELWMVVRCLPPVVYGSTGLLMGSKRLHQHSNSLCKEHVLDYIKHCTKIKQQSRGCP